MVDDNDELRALLRAWLGQHGCRVVEAADGPTAVSVARSERPDLILMDLHMPEMDGFAAAYRIRMLAKLGANVPIIAISADNELGVETLKPTSAAHAVGFDDFAPKPFSPGQLEDLLARHLPQGVGKPDGRREVGRGEASAAGADTAGNNVVFYHVENGAAVSSTPDAWLPYIPRAGETVALTTREGGGRKFFKVVEVIYDFSEVGGHLKLQTVSVDIKDIGVS